MLETLRQLYQRVLEGIKMPAWPADTFENNGQEDVDEDSSSESAEFPGRLEPQPTPVVIPIEESIDLHTFAPRETRSVVDEYLREAHRRGFKQVRIIHGKGRGVQRRIVHSTLEKHPLVVSFDVAPPSRGGWGATLAWLAPRPPLDGK